MPTAHSGAGAEEGGPGVLHALADLGVPRGAGRRVVFELDARRNRPRVLLQALQHVRDRRVALPPRHVFGAIVAELLAILEVHAVDPRVQLLDERHGTLTG